MLTRTHDTHPAYASSTVLSWLCVLAVIVCGCERKKDHSDTETFQTIVISEEGSAETGRVWVYGPPSGSKHRDPDYVEIVWDGKTVFSGALPVSTSGISGKQVKLLDIRTSVGEHTLAVVHGGVREEKEFLLGEGKTVMFMLFDYVEGRSVLINQLDEGSGFD